jgi:sporulation protein YlmC with PRC-barrel domain
MKQRIMTMTALAAVLAFAAPAVNAQTMQRNSADQQGVTATNPAGSDMIMPNEMRASKVIGADVYDRDNKKLGDVQDVVLDKSGRVAAVVVNVGGFLGMGTKNVAVKFSDIKFDNRRLTLDRTKAQLQQAANYQLTDKETGAGQSPSPVTGGQGGSGSSAPIAPARP